MAQDLIERARRLSTATLGDALDMHGVHGVMSGIPRRSGEGRVAGFAQTMLEHVGPLGTYGFSDFTVGSGLDSVVAGTVLVIDMGGADVSTFGGLAALAVTLRGAAAVVIDGGCRDLEEVRESGLTVASRTVTPRTGKGRLKVMSRGRPVTCGGVAVRPGDLIILDDTGTVVIPAESAGRILLTAEELGRQDTAFATRLREGRTFAEAAKMLRHA